MILTDKNNYALSHDIATVVSAELHVVTFRNKTPLFACQTSVKRKVLSK